MSSGDTTQPPSPLVHPHDIVPDGNRSNFSSEPKTTANASQSRTLQTHICNKDMNERRASRLCASANASLVVSVGQSHSPTSGTLRPCPSVFEGVHSQGPCKLSGPSDSPSHRSERPFPVTLPHVLTHAQVKRTCVKKQSATDIHDSFNHNSIHTIHTATTSHLPIHVQANSHPSVSPLICTHAPGTEPCCRPCYYSKHTNHVKNTHIDTRHLIATSPPPFTKPQNNSPPDNMPVLSALPVACTKPTGPLVRNGPVSTRVAQSKTIRADRRAVHFSSTGSHRNEPIVIPSDAAINGSKHRLPETRIPVDPRSHRNDEIPADGAFPLDTTGNNHIHRGQTPVSVTKSLTGSTPGPIGKGNGATVTASSVLNNGVQNIAKASAKNRVRVRTTNLGLKLNSLVGAEGLENNVSLKEGVQRHSVKDSTRPSVSNSGSNCFTSKRFVNNQSGDETKTGLKRSGETCGKTKKTTADQEQRDVSCEPFKTKRKAARVTITPSKRIKRAKTICVLDEARKVAKRNKTIKNGGDLRLTTVGDRNSAITSVENKHRINTSNQDCKPLAQNQETWPEMGMGWNFPSLQPLPESAKRAERTRLGNVRTVGSKHVYPPFADATFIKDSGAENTCAHVPKYSSGHRMERETVEKSKKVSDEDVGTEVDMSKSERKKLISSCENLRKENEALRLGVIDKVLHCFETKHSLRGKPREVLEQNLKSQKLDTTYHLPAVLRVLESVEIATKLKVERVNEEDVFGVWMRGLAKVEDWGVESIVQIMRLVRRRIIVGSPLDTKVQHSFKSLCCGIVSELLSHTSGIRQETSSTAVVRSGTEELQELVVTFLVCNSDLLWSNVIFTDVLRALVLPLLQKRTRVESSEEIGNKKPKKKSCSITQTDRTQDAMQLVLKTMNACSRKITENPEQNGATKTLCKRNVRTMCRRIAASAGCMVTLAELSVDKYNSNKSRKDVRFAKTREVALFSYDYLSMRFHRTVNYE